VAIAGVDGAGKSTQVELLEERLRARGLAVSTIWCRWDPVIARPAVRLLGLLARHRQAATPGASVTERRRSIRARALANPWAARAWRALMVVDYGLRMAPAVRRARRKSDVVILDRYWHDVMVDFSFGGPLRDPPGLLRRLLPDPRCLVVLDVPERVALARKPESPDVRHVSERRRLYGEAARRYGGVVIDAAREPSTVFLALSAAIAAVAGAPEGTTWAAR
jgi:dTMP kinase